MLDPNSFDGEFNWRGLLVAIGIVLFWVVVASSITLALTGCSSTQEIQSQHENSSRVAEFQKEAAIGQRATLSGTCTTGCSFHYIDPRDRVKVIGVKYKTKEDVWDNNIGTLVNGGLIAGGIYGMTKMIDTIADAAKGTVVNINGDSNVVETGRTSAVGDTTTTEDNDVTTTTETQDNDVTTTTTTETDSSNQNNVTNP